MAPLLWLLVAALHRSAAQIDAGASASASPLSALVEAAQNAIQAGDAQLAADHINNAMDAKYRADHATSHLAAEEVAPDSSADFDDVMKNIDTLKGALKTVISRVATNGHRDEVAQILGSHRQLFEDIHKTQVRTMNKAQHTEMELSSLILVLKDVERKPPEENKPAATTVAAATEAAQPATPELFDDDFKVAAEQFINVITEMRKTPKLATAVDEVLLPHSAYLRRLSQIQNGEAHAYKGDILQVQALAREMIDIPASESYSKTAEKLPELQVTQAVSASNVVEEAPNPGPVHENTPAVATVQTTPNNVEATASRMQAAMEAASPKLDTSTVAGEAIHAKLETTPATVVQAQDSKVEVAPVTVNKISPTLELKQEHAANLESLLDPTDLMEKPPSAIAAATAAATTAAKPSAVVPSFSANGGFNKMKLELSQQISQLKQQKGLEREFHKAIEPYQPLFSELDSIKQTGMAPSQSTLYQMVQLQRTLNQLTKRDVHDLPSWQDVLSD